MTNIKVEPPPESKTGPTEYQRKYQRKWIANRRRAWLAANGPCVKCGGTTKLQVDHIDPNKKDSHRIWSWSLPRREAELAKCQVLCAKCHDLKTRGVRQHGTQAMYRRLGCRCEKCRAWKRRTR